MYALPVSRAIEEFERKEGRKEGLLRNGVRFILFQIKVQLINSTQYSGIEYGVRDVKSSNNI